MQIGIYGSNTHDTASKTIKKILDDSDIESFNITKSKNKHADCIIVLGGDKGVRFDTVYVNNVYQKIIKFFVKIKHVLIKIVIR